MRSETPKDRDPFNVGANSPEDREHTNSMAMDLLDTPGGDGSSDGLTADGGDGGTMLLPHERKLPLSEQRRIIAARKQHDDGVDEDDSIAMGGRRGRGRRRPNADPAQDPGQRRGHGGGRHGEDRGPARAEGDADAGQASAGGNARGPVEKTEDTAAAGSGSGSGGGSRIERDAEATVETASPDRKPPAATTRDAVRLDDPAHPHAPLYGAALKAVAELAPTQAAMGPTEQANVAAALTARMAGDAGFAQQLNDPSRLSFGLAQNGDRLFAINHPVPGAPNAMHVSVDIEQARTLSVEASSGHADLAKNTREPAHEQVIEAHTREHGPRQA